MCRRRLRSHRERHHGEQAQQTEARMISAAPRSLPVHLAIIVGFIIILDPLPQLARKADMFRGLNHNETP